MRLNTASEVISMSREMETAGSSFYRELATAYPEAGEQFLAFAKENEKFIAQIKRAYYSVISDALEGGFAFDLDPEPYRLKLEMVPGISLKEGLKKALELEAKMVAFYEDGAEQSMSLMADVPRAFKKVAQKREQRQAVLKGMAPE